VAARGTSGAAVGPLVVAGVGFLNARPLLAGLEAGIPAPVPYRLLTAEPARCAEMLARGEAHAGLVPVAAAAELPGVACLPGLGIAAAGPVWSVLLVARRPLEAVRRLAVHAASRSSAALAELLFRRDVGVAVEVRRVARPLAELEGWADAAVVIGDPALAVRGRTGHREEDLAAWWHRRTGLPFVFALWGLAPHPRARELAALLERSAAYGSEHVDALVADLDGRRELAREYLTRRLRYRLGKPELAGLGRFLAEAAAEGLVAGDRVRWLGEGRR